MKRKNNINIQIKELDKQMDQIEVELKAAATKRAKRGSKNNRSNVMKLDTKNTFGEGSIFGKSSPKIKRFRTLKKAPVKKKNPEE